MTNPENPLENDQSEQGLTDDQETALAKAFEGAVAYRRTLPQRIARPTIGLDEATERFQSPLGELGDSGEDVIQHIIADADDGLHQMSAPSFFAYVCGGSHPVGVAADFLVSAWGQNAGSAYESPAITGMERAVCDWVLDLLSLPANSGVGIVTGATVANTEGIMAARHALLAAKGWDVEENGLFGAPEFPVLVGADAHSAPLAGLRYAGIGAGKVTHVATDSDGRIDVGAFKNALDGCSAPPLVILQAGQINTGAFDRFHELIPLVHERWMGPC